MPPPPPRPNSGPSLPERTQSGRGHGGGAPKPPAPRSGSGDSNNRRRKFTRLSDLPLKTLAVTLAAAILTIASVIVTRSGDSDGQRSGDSDPSNSAIDGQSPSGSGSTTSVPPLDGFVVAGVVNQQIFDLANGAPVALSIGDQSVELDAPEFRSASNPDTTGLAMATAGEDVLGLDVVPKSELLEEFEMEISLESTAVALVLLRPELSEFFTLGDPVWDAGMKMMIANTSTFASLVLALESELAAEGSSYLRELAPRTKELILDTINSLRLQFGEGVSGGPGEAIGGRGANLRLRRSAEVEQPTSGANYEYSCDEGLLPISGAEADGLCFEVVTPSRESWEQYDFSGDMQIRVENKSPRMALLYYQSSPNAEASLIGFVPPLSVPSPSAIGIISKLFGSAVQTSDWARYKLQDQGTLEVLDDDDWLLYDLPDAREEGKLTAVTAFGSQDLTLDSLLNTFQFDRGRVASAAVTFLSSYLFPALSVVLDSRNLSFRTTYLRKTRLFTGCPVSTIPDLVGDFKYEDFYNGNQIRLQALTETSGVMTKMYWFVVIRLVVQGRSILKTRDDLEKECQKALADAESLSTCLPSLNAISALPTNWVSATDCLDSEDLVNELIASGVKRALVNIGISPFEKLDTALAAGSLTVTAFLAVTDRLRFANVDAYPLSTIRVPRWCYEVGQSRLRILGPRPIGAKSPKNLTDFVLDLRAFGDRVSTWSSRSFWVSESQSWQRIATLATPDFVADSAALRRDATEVSTKFSVIASWFPSDDLWGRAKGGAMLLSEEGRKEIRELTAAVQRIEFSWKTCPNAGP